ncbi:MAG TPA: lactonase family protein [Catenuloplanes sp.]
MDSSELIFLGCYTGESGGKGEGVTAVRRDPRTGGLSRVGVAAPTPSPSFLARHPVLPVLYAANELDEGTVSAWEVDGDGGLTALAVEATGGAHPCHLAVTPDGRHLITANYGSGSLAVHALDDRGTPGRRCDLLTHDGRGPDPQRQDGPHAHMVAPEPHRSEVLAVDLGADRVYRHRLDPVSGRLVPQGVAIQAAPGAGPRHLARHPDGRGMFLVAELDATVTGYEPDPADGRLREWARFAASGHPGSQPSEIVVSPDGRFLYVGNRGPDTVSVFALSEDPPIPVAEVPSGGRWPRHFTVLGGYLYVANERSHSVAIFRIDPETGIPHPAGAPLDQGSPTCVLRWSPAYGR